MTVNTAGLNDSSVQQASYDEIFRSQGLADQPRFYRWIAGLLPLAPGRRVLDVACGAGGLIAELGDRVLEATGLDVSAEALRATRTRTGLSRLVVGNAEQLPFATGSFDGVTCLGSLENFARPSEALAEMRRVLKSGGVFCAMMPNRYWAGDAVQAWRGGEEQIPFQRYERSATILEWRRLLEAGGFRVRRVRGYSKTTPLISNGKLRSINKFLSSRMFAALPASMAWSIVYVCERTEGPGRSSPRGGAWVWRAEQVAGG